jgi:predicted MFS family arabinose efflux permease
MSPYIGIYLGYLIGGVAAFYYSWRVAFFFAGIPGIIVGILIFTTVKEPRFGFSEAGKVDTKFYNLGDTMRYFLSNKTLLLCVIGYVLTTFTSTTLSAWLPSFLRRVHHLNSAQIGLWAGSIKGFFGIGGSLIGGFTVVAVSKRDEKWRILLPGIVTLLGAPALCLFFLAGTMEMSLFGLALATILVAFHVGPLFAVIQTVVKVRMRAFAASILFICVNLVSGGGAPLVIGALNDVLKPRFGDMAIRYSMLIGVGTIIIGGCCLMLASIYLIRDTKKAAAESPEGILAGGGGH